jgi:PAS domain S-box-containing protein
MNTEIQVEQEDISKIIFESISDGVFTTDHDCRITSFNRAAEKISGFRRHDAIGKFCFDIFRTDLCQTRCALRNTLENGKPVDNVRVTIITRDGRKVPISVSTTVLRDAERRHLGAVEFFRDLSEIENLKDKVFKLNEAENLVSGNEKMQHLFELLPEIAESECNVLVQGPSGSGKELMAQALHNLSPRRNNSYIRINCAALPETLLESELFGYARGAFTDAKRDKPGMFHMAQGGTLLLDEIGDMPLTLQVKLLRVLNNGEYQPLGSTRMLKTDARIITSSNRDLKEMVQHGAFREDLYYRINVINIDIPPLRERLEDLPLLIEHFIQKFRAKRKKDIRGASNEVLKLLRRYDFPGNVRELENAIEHAFVICRGTIIDPEHLPERILDAVNRGRAKSGRAQYSGTSEESIIKEALERNGGNRTKTAYELGMHRSTLWRKMMRYGIVA